MVRRLNRAGARGRPGVTIALLDSPEGHMMLDEVGAGILEQIRGPRSRFSHFSNEDDDRLANLKH
jgi:hypothetical protein